MVGSLEGTMMEGVDVSVGWKDVGRVVGEVMKAKGTEAADFVAKHPKEATFVLTAALVAMRLALAGRVSAQGPISGDQNYPEVVRVLTNGDPVAGGVIKGIVAVTETTSNC